MGKNIKVDLYNLNNTNIYKDDIIDISNHYGEWIH